MMTDLDRLSEPDGSRLIDALGGAQTIGLAIGYVLLALGSLAAIWIFANASTRENSSALALESAVSELHIVLRGLNESFLTQGSTASVALVRDTATRLDEMSRSLAREDGAPLSGWRGISERARSLVDAGSFDDERLIALGRISREIERSVVASSARAQAQRERAREAEQWVDRVIQAAAALILFGIASIFVAFHRNVTRPVGAAIQFAQRIAAGDLTGNLDAKQRGQVAQLLAALRDMQGQLIGVVKRIQHSGFAIRSAAEEAAAGNADLSSRTEEQASTLEETAANMEEITATVRTNADSAGKAIAVATQASEEARRGGELMVRVAGKMSAIAEVSQRVREITETIDGLAFQTNLLSLNAAVEAARAGEHGRGFAVVAGEVRSLAKRCSEASREIRVLIQQSGERVEEGMREVAVAGEAVGRIVTSVEAVARRVTEIAAASEQQRIGVEQMNQAITQMDGVTQQNASLVEQAAANAQAIEHQAAELSDAVAAFVVMEVVASDSPPTLIVGTGMMTTASVPHRGAKRARRLSTIS